MTIKQKACEVISRMPEDATFEDIQYHLYVLECIERGERDIEDGKTLTHDQVESRPAKWQDQSLWERTLLPNQLRRF